MRFLSTCWTGANANAEIFNANLMRGPRKSDHSSALAEAAKVRIRVSKFVGQHC